MMQIKREHRVISDLSKIIDQKQRELLYNINQNLINLLSVTDKTIDQQRNFKAELEEYGIHKINWLNTNLNLSLWELGKRINQESLENKDASIPKISIQLAEKYGPVFSEIDLYTMAKFAEIFPDRTVALGLSMLVRWEYFPILLSLSEAEAIFFYARLAATQGLSLANLQSQIVNNVYEQTSGAKEREQAAINVLQNPVTKIKVTKKGNATVVGTTIYIDDNTDVNPDVINIFKNPSLYILAPRIK